MAGTRITRSKNIKKRRRNRMKRIFRCFISFFAVCLCILSLKTLINIILPDNDKKIEKASNLKNIAKYTDSSMQNDQLTPEQKISASNKAKVDDVLKAAQYPDKIRELWERNPETIDFVLRYPKLHPVSADDIDISADYTEKQIPLFLQWDTRWGCNPYGNDGIIANDGCGPTCLSMVMVGITGDLSWNPIKVADFSAENSFIDKVSNSTSWELMSVGAKDLGLMPKELPLSESHIFQALENGHPIICSMRQGDFTSTGHFIVLYGVEDGKILLHDPNSIIRSQQKWDFSTLEFQIKNLWAFSKS